MSVAQRVRTLKKYELTVEGYDELLLKQGGRCAICGKKPGKMRLAVDHDHLIQKQQGVIVINGLIHLRENRALGAFEYDTAVLESLVRYVNRIISNRKQADEDQAA